MKIDELGKKILFFDGGFGTMLQKYGMAGGEIPERLNIDRGDTVRRIHEEYLRAGADFLTMNTFGALGMKAAGKYDLEESIFAAARLAREAVTNVGGKRRYIALDIGPSGRLLEPLGDFSFDAAYEEFKRTAILGEKAGADIAVIETMSDTLEAKAAVLAVKENTSLPVFCTMTFDTTHKTLTGGTVEIMAAMLEGLGADCIGINCGLGPEQILQMAGRLCAAASVPVIIQPNAGLPKIRDGKTVYDVEAKQFGVLMEEFAKLGVSVLGGCCGTTPEHIAETVRRCEGYAPVVTEKEHTVVTSYSRTVTLGAEPVIIGERINPTGKKKFKEALRAGNMSYILNEAIAQEEAGAHILDVNVGLPEINEADMMEEAVKAISSTVNLPLQIDSSEPAVLERALRIYNGKPMINSVNGKRESMEAVFPLVKKYGGVVVGLALDEDGIPPTAEGRYKIAEKIVNTAAEYGIKRRDIVIDALTLTISAQQKESAETVKALKMIKEGLGVKTVLGVSNISFGLPRRELVNSVFFAGALNAGLDCCIINPCAQTMMDTYRSYMALAGFDENCADYISCYQGTKAAVSAPGTERVQSAPSFDCGNDKGNELYELIVKGLKDESYEKTKAALEEIEPLEVINKVIVPALDHVGAEFEVGRMFLPQLMMSAETVKQSFAAVKERIEASGQRPEMKGKILVATVKGDIHDIGKNIVKVLLENYGYEVVDLGKDVPPELIVKTLKEEDIHLCGLSALMTTTVVSMEETIKAIRAAGLGVKVWAGGAVMNKEYAEMIGADAYCRDALASVNYAEEFFAEMKSSS